MPTYTIDDLLKYEREEIKTALMKAEEELSSENTGDALDCVTYCLNIMTFVETVISQ